MKQTYLRTPLSNAIAFRAFLLGSCAIFLVSCAVFLVSCGKRTEQSAADTTASRNAVDTTANAVQQGTGKGLVKAVDLKAHSITLAHNDIPGVIGAMTMMYTLDSSATVNGAKPGDSVSFTLTSRGSGEFVVTSVSPIVHK